MSSDIREALAELDKRLRECFGLPISAEEAYDSFYQEIVADALASSAGTAEQAIEKAAQEADHWQALSDRGPRGCKCGGYIAAAIRALASPVMDPADRDTASVSSESSARFNDPDGFRRQR